MCVKLTFVISLVAFFIHHIECLECYNCTDVAHVSDCSTVTQCPAGNMCQAKFTSNKYTLGCGDQSSCSAMNTSLNYVPGGSGSIIGRSLTSSVQDGCAECCETGNCNRQLCQIQSNTCSDSGTLDCILIGSVVNLCADTDHAKAVCKKFCGLCEVDGNWSSWSEWTVCSRSCDNGTETRSRSCSDPAPANDGTNCTGTSQEIRACSGSPCPVNGGWASWLSWGGCSVSCGVGIQRRGRVCSSPYPSHGGSYCVGDPKDDRVCLPGACQDGNWSVWGSWASCSKTCGGGIQTRSRSCTNPAPSALGHYCTGDPLQVQQCSEKACADEKIGFSVSSPATTSHSNRIRFNAVVSNEGAGYSTTTGEFTCTVPGMYFFSVTLLTSYTLESNNYATCVIYKNSHKLQKVFTQPYHTSNHTYYSATVTVYIHLTAGDIVYLGACTSVTTIDGASEFTGFLVVAD